MISRPSRLRLSPLECGDSSPLSFSHRFPRGKPTPTPNRREKESGDESPHSKEAHTLTAALSLIVLAIFIAALPTTALAAETPTADDAVLRHDWLHQAGGTVTAAA